MKQIVILVLIGISTAQAQESSGVRPLDGAGATALLDSTYNSLTYLPESPSVVNIGINVPGVFPVADALQIFRLDCSKLSDAAKSPVLKAILKGVSTTKYDKGIFSNKDFYIGCEDGHIFAKSPSFPLTVYAMDSASPLQPALVSDLAINIRMYDGYQYPNIKEGFFYSDLRVTIDSGSVSAEERYNEEPGDGTGIVVGLKQGSKVQPILFNGNTTDVTYDSSQPMSVFYMPSSLSPNKGWYSLDIRYDLGKIAWRKIPGPLK